MQDETRLYTMMITYGHDESISNKYDSITVNQTVANVNKN